MKRLIFLLIFFIIFTLGCTSASVKYEKSAVNKHAISDYYPFLENRCLIYQGEGNEYAGKDVFTDFIKKNRMQLRIINGGTTVSQVLENINGELRIIVSRGEFYYRDNLTDAKNPRPEVLLKEPLKKGTTWLLPNGSRRSITGVDVNVSTSLGKFKALEVTTEEPGNEIRDYYAVDTGLVKSVFISNGSKISSSLKTINRDARVRQTIKFYYPYFEKCYNVYVRHTINLKTNEEVKTYFEKYFKKSPGKGLSNTLGVNTKLKSLLYSNEKEFVHADFSGDLVREMNAGASLEGMIITCIVNTLGDYYNTNNVYITIEGKPYSSGHILMKVNEPFKVNYKNTKEYK